MVDLMLDVEALGNIPGCVLCQYTLVPFHINGKTYEGPMSPFDLYLHIGEQIAEGYDVDTDTLAWWMTNPVEVRRKVLGGNDTIKGFCSELTEYIQEVVKQHASYRIWSTSAKVDFGIPPVLFKRSNFPYPISHKSERCGRTYLEIAKHMHPSMKGTKLKVTHNAIDDCKKQIDELQIAYYHMFKKDKQSESIEAADTALIL